MSQNPLLKDGNSVLVDTEQYLNFLAKHGTPKTMSLQYIQAITQSVEMLKRVVSAIKETAGIHCAKVIQLSCQIIM